MARIRKHSFKAWDVVVTYSTRRERFEIAIPDEMKSYASMREDRLGANGYVSADTEASVVFQFENLAIGYLAGGVKREKYLAVGIRGSEENDNSYHDDYFRAGGKQTFLGISWAIVEKITAGGRDRYKYMANRNKEEEFTESANFIPWTPSREAFLVSVTDSLQKIAERTKTFFESESLATEIDLKKIPLIGFTPKGIK